MALPTIAELEAQLAQCDKLREKPKPAPRVSKSVTQAEYDANPDDFVSIAGRNLARRCKGWSRQQQRRCKQPVSKGSNWCKHHGARNRGPTTPEGLAKCAEVNLVHGKATRQGRRDHRAAAARLRVLGKAADELVALRHRRRL